MSSSFTLACAVRTKRRFISYWATTPFTSVGVDNNEESKPVCTRTVLLPITPNTDVSGTSQKDGRTHLQTHSLNDKRKGVLCLNTLTQSCRRTKSQRRRPVATCLTYSSTPHVNTQS